MKAINIVGARFGRLTVTAMAGARCTANCECGAVVQTEKYSLRKGLTKSCGCLRHEAHHRTHGESVQGNWTPEYRAWVNMNTRCYNPKSTRFADWGGRGITVADEWRHDYPAFLASVGRRPSPKHSLDRFPDVSGGYKPGNVRWATTSQQSRNTRSNRQITAFGKTMVLADWADLTGLKAGIILGRITAGWQAERALTAPPRFQKNQKEAA